MSAHVSVSQKKDYGISSVHLIRKKPTVLPFATSDTQDPMLMGVLGALVVTSILVTGLYLVVRYLL
jgi:hypothetical protein